GRQPRDVTAPAAGEEVLEDVGTLGRVVERKQLRPRLLREGGEHDLPGKRGELKRLNTARDMSNLAGAVCSHVSAVDLALESGEIKKAEVQVVADRAEPERELFGGKFHDQGGAVSGPVGLPQLLLPVRREDGKVGDVVAHIDRGKLEERAAAA